MNCYICSQIQSAQEKKNDFFVCELSTGLVVLGDHQYFQGYTLFLSKIHVTELHDHPQRDTYLKETAIVGEAVWKAFHPKKLNYEILGNQDPHLHTHIFPRTHDPMIGKPLYYIPQNERSSDKYIPSSLELIDLKTRLKKELPQ